MILKVEKKFRDKITNEIRKVDDVFEVADDRGAELLADKRNLVTQVNDTTQENKPRKTSKTRKKSGK
jgi:hypothetical protein